MIGTATLGVLPIGAGNSFLTKIGLMTRLDMICWDGMTLRISNGAGPGYYYYGMIAKRIIASLNFMYFWVGIVIGPSYWVSMK
jgi:hypothetical protein